MSYHWRDGITVERLPDGGVRIAKEGVNLLPDIPPNDWCSMVCQASAGGEENERWYVAMGFHGVAAHAGHREPISLGEAVELGNRAEILEVSRYGPYTKNDGSAAVAELKKAHPAFPWRESTDRTGSHSRAAITPLEDDPREQYYPDGIERVMPAFLALAQANKLTPKQLERFLAPRDWADDAHPGVDRWTPKYRKLIAEWRATYPDLLADFDEDGNLRLKSKQV